MRRSLFASAGAALPILACLMAPAAHAAGEPILTLAQVHPGMSCTASTVISGLEPVDFNAQVISVEGGPRPSDALIVMRFSGPNVESTGVAEGFSGSPVRCDTGDGVPRDTAPITRGLGQYNELVAGVTPIEAMLATPSFGEAPAATVIGEAPLTSGSKKKLGATKAKAASTKTTKQTTTAATAAKPIGNWGAGSQPLTLAGVRGVLGDKLIAAAAKAKVTLRVAPSATRSAAAPPGGLKPGDAVAASLVSGDIYAGAIGTVTYVDGDRVWAFGHPFNGSGPSRLLMERAQISTVIQTPTIGDQVGYKLGSPVGAVGTIGFDGSAAIGGVLGATPPMIDSTVTVRNGAGDVVQTASAKTVDERAVRGGTTGGLLPLAAATNAAAALQRFTTQDTVGGSTHTCTTIYLKNNNPVPLYQCVDTIVPNPDPAAGGAETGVADAVGLAVGPVSSGERFLKLVDRVKVDVRYRKEADTADIVRIRKPTSAKAGRLITIRVVVIQGSTGERREIPLQVRIPKAAAGIPTAIVVLSDDASASSESSDSGSLDELFFTEDEGGSTLPKNLSALRAGYTADGVSGLRAVVLPGFTKGEALDLLGGGDPSDYDLSEQEYEALLDRVKLVKELPTVETTGSAGVNVTPR